MYGWEPCHKDDIKIFDKTNNTHETPALRPYKRINFITQTPGQNPVSDRIAGPEHGCLNMVSVAYRQKTG
ncbi:MAG: hypothetical protein A2464_05680 [Deltaproteobacteria bacterium RIFOXYC2_FULL_48_10]|nr:MAG: hypothetical protein A2464_05680 [Deltaproteobacteria bacterium RIFOXYC2_FULL_48_10]